MTSTTNVLILSSDTGGGHRSAALALQDSLKQFDTPERKVEVEITRVLEEASFLTRQMANLYNWLLRHRQDWVRYYFNWIERSRPNESQFLFNLAQRYGRQVLERQRPDVIVSVHPMTQHLYAHLLRQLNLSDRVPLVTVVTDPCDGFWRGWACPDVRRYFVASEAARNQLIDYGIESQRIQIAGMPIHLDFQPVSPEQKAQLRLKYGLKPDKFTLLINAGWVGGGNVPKIYQTLSKARDLDIQVVFLAGRNYALKEQALKLARNSKIPIAILGFLPNIRDLMNLADVMVSKLGGLTTFEAIACELPIIADTLTDPMPQEARTVKWLKQLDMGIFLDRPEQIVEAIASFLESPERLQAIKCAYRTHARPDAARSIARQILNLGDRAVI